MSACCNNGFKMIHEVMGFKMWLGLIGPAGPAGPAGKDVQLRGPVATVGDLPTTAPASELWQVGTQAPYNGYFFNGTSWVNLGPVAAGTTFTPAVSSDGVISWINDGGLPNPESVNIKGPQGPAGADGSDGVTFTPAVSSAGVISWTNDGSLPNPEPVNIKGPQGQTGPAGPGVPSGGSTGQVLKKQSATDYDSAWGTDNTVIISDTQPSASDNKLWVDTDSSNGDNYLIPTMADMNAANAAQDANIGIVQTGSTATQNITKGQYVIWNGALYTASAAIASGATLSSSNLTVVTGGGLNALGDWIRWFLPAKYIMLDSTHSSFSIPDACRLFGITLDSDPAYCGLYYFNSTGAGVPVTGRFSSTGLTPDGSQNNVISFTIPAPKTMVVMLYSTDIRTLANTYVI